MIRRQLRKASNSAAIQPKTLTLARTSVPSAESFKASARVDKEALVLGFRVSSKDAEEMFKNHINAFPNGLVLKRMPIQSIRPVSAPYWLLEDRTDFQCQVRAHFKPMATHSHSLKERMGAGHFSNPFMFQTPVSVCQLQSAHPSMPFCLPFALGSLSDLQSVDKMTAPAAGSFALAPHTQCMPAVDKHAKAMLQARLIAQQVFKQTLHASLSSVHVTAEPLASTVKPRNFTMRKIYYPLYMVQSKDSVSYVDGHTSRVYAHTPLSPWPLTALGVGASQVVGLPVWLDAMQAASLSDVVARAPWHWVAPLTALFGLLPYMGIRYCNVLGKRMVDEHMAMDEKRRRSVAFSGVVPKRWSDQEEVVDAVSDGIRKLKDAITADRTLPIRTKSELASMEAERVERWLQMDVDRGFLSVVPGCRSKQLNGDQVLATYALLSGDAGGSRNPEWDRVWRRVLL